MPCAAPDVPANAGVSGVASARLRDLFSSISRARYLLWRALCLRTTFTAKLKSGESLRLRPRPSDDIDTAFEIFAAGVYTSPRKLNRTAVRRIVDLGANVGMSCLFFGGRFPDATILAVEPDPEHIRLARQLAVLNGMQDRIEFECAAADVTARAGFLVGMGVSAHVVYSAASSKQRVSCVDIFSLLTRTQPEFLKIDIEGGEYAILGDPRFLDLSAGAIVLEWHQQPNLNGREFCTSRLFEAGYEVVPGAWNTDQNGFLWGYRANHPICR